MRGPRGDRGSASVEFMGLLPMLLLVTFAVVQGFLALAAITSADAAARAGARALSRGATCSEAADASRSATTSWLRDDVQFKGEADGTARIEVSVPPLVPALGGELYTVVRRAWLPGSERPCH